MFNKVLKKTGIAALALTVMTSMVVSAMPVFGIPQNATITHITSTVEKQEPVYTNPATGEVISASEFKKEYAVAVPVIMYHKFSDEIKEQNEWCITSAQLKADFIEYKKAGFTPVTVSEYRLLSHLYKTAAFSPTEDFAKNIEAFMEMYAKFPNPILITVDDGYDDGYEILFPLLQEYGFKANISVVGLYSEKSPDYLSEEEIKALATSGLVEIGNHTYELHEASFAELDSMYNAPSKKEEIKRDYIRNERYLTAILGEIPAYFTYPNGLHSDMTEEILTEMGTQVSFVTNSTDTFITLNSDTRRIPRINRLNDVSSTDFVLHIAEILLKQTGEDTKSQHTALIHYCQTGGKEAEQNNELQFEEVMPKMPDTGHLKFGFNDKKYDFTYEKIGETEVLKLEDVFSIESAYVSFFGGVCRVVLNGRTIFVKGMTKIGEGNPDTAFLDKIYIPAREMFEKLGYKVDAYPATGEIIVY